MTWLARGEGLRKDQSWLALVSDATSATYKCPSGYMDDWLRAIRGLAAHDMRLAAKAYGEIPEVLGLPPGSVGEAAKWMGLCAGITSAANANCEDPTWSQTVDARVAHQDTGALSKQSPVEDRRKPVLWAEKNRRAMEQRQFCIPGTSDALMVGLREDEPPREGGRGSRWVLIHATSRLRFDAFNAVEGWSIGQVSFLANWMYRRLPREHPVWTESDPDTVRACLEPIIQQGLNTRDWSGYQEARKFEIKDETARLTLLVADYGISDHPDEEEPADVRQANKFQREQNQLRGYPKPGFGYEDPPDQTLDLFNLRLAYLKQKYMQ